MAMNETKGKTGISLAFVSLLFLGVMPIIANSRPEGFNALSFAFFLSVWQLVFSVPLVLSELLSNSRGIFDSNLKPSLKRRTIVIILITGMIFGLSTFLYVLGMERAGATSAAIAIQAYPLFSILWEALFLKRRKTILELALTLLLILALYYLGTGGSWKVEGMNYWFLVTLGVPFLWSIAHVVIKEVLVRTPISPAQVTFFRVLVSSFFLGILALSETGIDNMIHEIQNVSFQKFALIMGLVYYLELIVWFYAVRSIDVSLASSIVTPWPALTMILAFFFLGDQIEEHQVIALCVVAMSVYGILFANAQKEKDKILI